MRRRVTKGEGRRSPRKVWRRMADPMWKGIGAQKEKKRRKRRYYTNHQEENGIKKEVFHARKTTDTHNPD